MALRLLRAQAFHAMQPTEATRRDVLDTLTEVRDRSLLSTLRYVSTATMAWLSETDEGAPLAELIERNGLPLLKAEPITSAPLTPAEFTVLEHLAAGLSRQEIADTLVVSLSTVKTHLRTAYKKLGATSRADAIAALERVRVPNR